MRSFEYRIYPNKAQSHLLIQCLIETRHIYNDMLAAVKQQYEQDGTFPSKYDLNVAFKGRGGEAVPASCVQMLSDRLSKALKRFLAAKENHIPVVGFPRFKKPNRWHTTQLRQPPTDSSLEPNASQLPLPK